MPTGVVIFALVVVGLIAITLLAHVWSVHQREVMKLKYLHEGDGFERDVQKGTRVGMLKAAELLRSFRMVKGSFTLDSLAASVEAAAPPEPKD